MAVLEEMLLSRNFMRVSKSALINLDKVVKYVTDSNRTLIVTLTGKVTVRVSRSKVHEFKEAVTSIT